MKISKIKMYVCAVLVLPVIAVMAAGADLKELTGRLSSKDPAERRSAAASLGDIDSKDSAMQLIKALDDQDFLVRMAAVDSLRKLNYPESVDALCRVLEKDKNSQVRHNSVLALQQLKDPKSIPSLIKALNDPDKGVRYQAPVALGVLRADAAVDELNILIKDPDKNMSEQAIRGLGRIKNPKSIPFIEEALFDTEKGVQIAAADALSKMNSRNSISKIRILLKNSDSTVRLVAGEALAFMQDTDGLEVGLDLLGHKDVNIRRRAISLIGSTGDRSHIHILKRYEKDEELKNMVDISVERIKNRHPEQKKD